MTRAEQKRLVRELTKNVTADITAKIDAGKVPDSWNGIELRALLADTFGACAMRGLLQGQRKREYKNTVLANNL